MDQSRPSNVADINGAELHYELTGEGPDVVLLHAGIADRRMWIRQVEILSQSHRVLHYDARGYGESTLPGGPYSMADDLLGLLDHLAIQRAALMGSSMGGSAVLDFAVEHPDRITALVLVAPGLDGHEWSKEMNSIDAEEEAAFQRGDADAYAEINLRAWIDGPRRAPGDVAPEVREFVRDMLMTSFATQSTAYGRVPEPGPPRRSDPPVKYRLDSIDVPVLVIVGSEDVADMSTIADLLEAGIPHAEKARIEGVSHLPNLEAPEEFDRIVTDFFGRVGI